MLDNFFDEIVDNTGKPTPTERAYYLFFEKGISFNDFKNIPLPYVLSMVKTHNYFQKEEEKEMKKRK